MSSFGLHQKILLVEDEEGLGETLSEYLQEKGATCLWAKTAADAQSAFKSLSPDLVLMDIGLPDGDGIELARDLLKQRPSTPLLFLSAQNDPETKVAALESGGMDYMTKPFALKELMFRLSRILPHEELQNSENYVFGPLKIWFDRHEYCDALGNVRPLSRREAIILRVLVESPGKTISREEMMDKAWGEDLYPSHRTIDNYIVNLRKWADSDPSKTVSILNIRGVGYKFVIKN